MSNNIMNLKIVFFGSSPLSVYALEKLHKAGDDLFKIVGVVTKKDAIVGKKRQIQQNPVKSYAISNGIAVCDDKTQVESFLRSVNADLSIVMAYGHIIKKNVLETPKYGFINIHGSLLPHFRGAIPIQMAIFEGLETSGVTIMKMDEGLDTGDIIDQEEIKIEQNDNFETYGKKIAEKGVDLILKDLESFVNGTISLTKQDESKVSICTIKDTEKLINLNWEMDARTIKNAVNALAPFDHPRISLAGVNLNLYSISVLDRNIPIGEWVVEKENGIRLVIVGTSNASIVLELVQPEGKKMMNGSDFWNGYLRTFEQK